MIPERFNILSSLHPAQSCEVFETIARTDTVRIERIVSCGQATPPGEWYDQGQDEWVLVLTGSAGLLFEGAQVPVTLGSGDYLLIPAGCRHRVEWTETGVATVWLAVHFGPGEQR